MKIKIDYTGKILVGNDFIGSYYIHMGYQQAYGYKILKEFIFENGNLTDVNDRSAEAAEFRKTAEQNDKIFSAKELYGKEAKSINIVEKSFSLDYKDKCRWLK